MWHLEELQQRNEEEVERRTKARYREKVRRARRRAEAVRDKQRPRRWLNDFEFSEE